MARVISLIPPYTEPVFFGPSISGPKLNKPSYSFHRDIKSYSNKTKMDVTPEWFDGLHGTFAWEYSSYVKRG